MSNSLQGVEEGQQRAALAGIEIADGLTRLFGFAAMPEDGLQQVARTAIMQELGVAIDRLGQAYAPERRGAPLPATGLELRSAIGQAVAHIVQQQVAVGTDGLPGQFRLGGIRRSHEAGRVALGAAGVDEQLLAANASALALYYDLGGEILTLGSDAHTPEDASVGIREGAELLRTIGFRYYTVFEQRKPTFLSLE